MKFTYTCGQRPLEGYVIKRGIGKGGFGEVYFAISDGGKEVALKLIRQNSDVELRGIAQCLNLKHANLVHLYDLRKDARGDQWLVMEYVAGESLADVLRRHPQGVPIELVCEWFAGLGAGVQHLHEHGIVHRDLKPGNIFLEHGVVKVGDYGLCKLMGSQRAGQTQSVGTVHYMAPEISTGNYNKQIDVYASGVILFELLTGTVPFDGESPGEILMKHLTSAADLRKVPAPFVPILEKALCKNPAQRFANIVEMSKRVGAVAGNKTDPQIVPQPSWTLPTPHADTLTPSQARADTVRNNNPGRLAEVSGHLLYAAVLSGLAAMVASALFSPGDGRTLVHLFYLTVASSWAVLVPTQWWARSVDDSAFRRLVLMGLGLVVGVFALWLDGYALIPSPENPPGVALLEPHKPGANAAPGRHPFYDALYPGNQSLPVLACYLSYFGLMFIALRWWKAVERHRGRRFSLDNVIATAFWAFILLFLLPAGARAVSFQAMVLTSIVVQLVSPWEAPAPMRARKLRLHWA